MYTSSSSSSSLSTPDSVKNVLFDRDLSPLTESGLPLTREDPFEKVGYLVSKDFSDSIFFARSLVGVKLLEESCDSDLLWIFYIFTVRARSVARKKIFHFVLCTLALHDESSSVRYRPWHLDFFSLMVFSSIQGAL